MRQRFSLDIPETLEDACDPAMMAVIVYDMQAGVVRQLPDGGAEAVERVSRVLTAARAGGYPVFFTRHMSLPARLMGAAQLRTAMAWQHVDDPEKVQSQCRGVRVLRRLSRVSVGVLRAGDSWRRRGR